MKILCLFQKFSFQSATIYLDLMNEFIKRGHQVTIVAGTSENYQENKIYQEEGCKVVYVRLPDQFKAGKIKKGLVQLMMEPKMISQIKRHFWKEEFDLILYPTPPITLANVVMKCKKHFHAKSYLMLKDIFPQNAVDLHMMREKSLIHRYFLFVEKNLYHASDYIGCMSKANIQYMKNKLAPIEQMKLELFPNTIYVKPIPLKKERESEKEITHFVFGGNLGKPQAIDFLLKGIEQLNHYDLAKFLIIGDGTESKKVETYIKEHKLFQAEYHRQLSREEYEKKLMLQDVGLVLLNKDFTIPNFPSRILSYMQMAKPILAVTDSTTDIGDVITKEAECGYFCPSDDVEKFVAVIQNICENKDLQSVKGNNGYAYLKEHYSVEQSVTILEKHFKLDNN